MTLFNLSLTLAEQAKLELNAKTRKLSVEALIHLVLKTTKYGSQLSSSVQGSAVKLKNSVSRETASVAQKPETTRESLRTTKATPVLVPAGGIESPPNLSQRISCPYCGVRVKAQRLVRHKNEKCPKNPAITMPSLRRKAKKTKSKVSVSQKRKLKLRTSSSLSGSRSIRTVQGGLPGLGKR